MILVMSPPTIIVVNKYVNKKRVKYFSILTYLSYGIKISDASINEVKERVTTTIGNCGMISLTDAAIAPISAPMFIVFAIRRRPAIGKTTFFEYFLFNTLPKPEPVTRPIRAQIS